MDKLTINQRIFISGLSGFLIGIVVFFMGSLVWQSFGSGEHLNSVSHVHENEDRELAENASQVASPTVANQAEAIVVENQEAGFFVTVAELELNNAGWVAIHEMREGVLGNVLGAAWFPRGTSRGSVSLLRATNPREIYHAVLYADDGDKVFELGVDAQIVTDGGAAVQAIFQTNQAL